MGVATIEEPEHLEEVTSWIRAGARAKARP